MRGHSECPPADALAPWETLPRDALAPWEAPLGRLEHFKKKSGVSVPRLLILAMRARSKSKSQHAGPARGERKKTAKQAFGRNYVLTYLSTFTYL